MKKGIEDLLTDSSFRQHILNPNFKENDFWENWLKESGENAHIYEQAKFIITDFYKPLSEEEYQSEAMTFKRKIDLTIADRNDIISLYNQRKEKKNNWFWYIAASFIVFLSAVITINWFTNASKVLKPVAPDSSKIIIKKEVGKGQKLTITFRDGTRVKLNSESYITYPEEFKSDFREVTLSGEAYFEVAHHDNWPFIVKSKDVFTKVLGTSFNISSYPEDCCVKIALVEGRIEVNTYDKTPINLLPKEMAKIEHDTIEVVDFDIRKTIAWKDNKIVFDRASYDEVQATLERWYNVRFVCNEKPIFKGGYTGEFSNLSLDAVLEGMSSGKFDYKLDGKKVYIN